jgi:inner membrane protein
VLVELDGSPQLQFLPLGRITNVELSSAWRDPSFCGAFLPDSHEISEDGFSAHWKVLDLNRSYPQRWQDTAYQTRASAFGVELMFPVDGYHKTSRTTKYAILFIALTFLSLFMTEILTRRRVHPVQYLLVGFALCVFYSLLLALMEHVGFGRAYLVSAAATVLLIGGYTRAVLGGWAMAALIGGIVTAIYAYLYVVLQLEDYALLMGSGGLFVALALVMYLTRRIDWYAVGHEKNARHDNG